MSDLVGNPEDRFSRDTAYIMMIICVCVGMVDGDHSGQLHFQSLGVGQNSQAFSKFRYVVISYISRVESWGWAELTGLLKVQVCC